MGQYLEECIILDLDIELIKTKLMKFNLSILLCYLFFNYSLNIDAQTKSDLIFVDGVCGMCEKRIETKKELPINFKFVTKDNNPDISFCKVGVNIGTLMKEIDDKSIHAHYFIKFTNNILNDVSIFKNFRKNLIDKKNSRNYIHVKNDFLKILKIND